MEVLKARRPPAVRNPSESCGPRSAPELEAQAELRGDAHNRLGQRTAKRPAAIDRLVLTNRTVSMVMQTDMRQFLNAVPRLPGASRPRLVNRALRPGLTRRLDSRPRRFRGFRALHVETRHCECYPRESLPVTAPAEARWPWRPTARVRPGNHPVAQHDRALLQPAQGISRHRHQKRKPLLPTKQWAGGTWLSRLCG